jgi:RND family efflux transporter MFP subunit
MSDTEQGGYPRIWIVLSLVVLLAVIIYLVWAEDSIDIEQVKKEPVAQIVTIENLRVTPETVKVASYAEVRPRWSAELRASVSGRILEVHDAALAGERVKADTTLITIDDSQYAADLLAADLALKEAQLELSKAEKSTAVARNQFKRNGTKPPNDLALHLPELRIAKSAVNSAKARLAASRQQLKDTTIKAPFSGFIVERFVSPGQSVNIGDPLVKLVDDRRFDLIADVGISDWLLLQQPLPGLMASVLNQDNKQIAYAKIRQGGGFLDQKTRQYRVFLEITASGETTVLSGDFVRVLLPGITVPLALNIPESALTQEGYIWYVDDEDNLQRYVPEVIFRHQNRIIIRALEGLDKLRIAIMPLASFLPGQQVQPQSVE